MSFSPETLAVAKTYTDETVIGGGALKGKNCTISSITEITGGHRVTFKWYLDDGTEQSAYMDVMDGQGGGGTGDYADLTNKPSINSVTLSGNKTTSDLNISYDDLDDKPTIPSIANCYQTTDSTGNALDDADLIPYYNDSESEKSNISWSGVKSTLKTYFDPIYAQNYSTTEQVMGTWIDGKPLYRKVIDTGALPNATEKAVAHGISNLDYVAFTYGMAKNPTSNATLTIPFPSASGNHVFVYSDLTNVYINSTGDRSTYTESTVIMLYTKTTT